MVLPHHSQDMGPAGIEWRELGVRGGRPAFNDPIKDTSAVSELARRSAGALFGPAGILFPPGILPGTSGLSLSLHAV